ncbi:XRE family transcriptional regulator [Streptomonospora sediminis]
MGSNQTGSGPQHWTANTLSGDAGTVVQVGSVYGNVYAGAGPLVKIPGELPPAPHGFSGRRAERSALSDALVNGGRGHGGALAAVFGGAGVGKTALALHVAHALTENFPDGQLYVDLHAYGSEGGPPTAGGVLSRFLRSLGVPADEIPSGTDERAALFRSLLGGRRLLVVLDNAPSERHIRPLLPGSSASAVLVTARKDLPGLASRYGSAVVQLGLLSRDEGVELLQRTVGPAASGDPAARLVGQCAGLPLALRLAADFMLAHPGWDIQRTVDALEDERARLDLAEPDEPDAALRAAFSWSYRALPDSARRLFRLSGLLPGSTFTENALAALAQAEQSVVDEALSALLRLHLFEAAGAGRYGMHDLLRAYARELLNENEDDDERQAATLRIWDFYLARADAADRVLNPYRYRIPIPRASAPDAAPVESRGEALAWISAEAGNMAALCRDSPPDPVLDDRLWRLAYTLKGYFFLVKEWDLWLATHQAALEATRRLDDRQAEGMTANNLGLARIESGDLDTAAEHYRAALEIFEELGEPHGRTTSIANLAWIHHYRGEYVRSHHLNTRALETYRSLGSDRNVGITLRGLALDEAALNRFDAAETHLQEALALFTGLGEALDTAMTYNCLGEVREQAGDHAAAAHDFAEAAERAGACRSVFEQARARDGEGRAAWAGGDIASAESHWAEALALYRRLRAREADDVERRLGGSVAPR